MTLDELSQLYYLSKELEADQRRYEALQAVAQAAPTQRLTGMPAAPHSNESNVERLALELVDLQAIIAARQIQCIHEQARLERWISDIPDSLTRQIYHYRFVEGYSWFKVAQAIGGNTADSVKQRCYRYLRRAEGEKAFKRAQKGAGRPTAPQADKGDADAPEAV